MKQKRGTTIVRNITQGKLKYSGYHSKVSPCCIPLISLPWKSIISNESPYKVSLIKGLWQEIWKPKILVEAIYSPLCLPPRFRNRKGRACFCSGRAAILSLITPLLTALMSLLKKDVWKFERNYRKNWWYRYLALQLETKALQWDLLNNKSAEMPWSQPLSIFIE